MLKKQRKTTKMYCNLYRGVSEEDRHRNIIEEDRHKLREDKKNQVYDMIQNELHQRVQQLTIWNIKDVLKWLKC